MGTTGCRVAEAKRFPQGPLLYKRGRSNERCARMQLRNYVAGAFGYPLQVSLTFRAKIMPGLRVTWSPKVVHSYSNATQVSC